MKYLKIRNSFHSAPIFTKQHLKCSYHKPALSKNNCAEAGILVPKIFQHARRTWQRQHAVHFFHCFYVYSLHFVHKIAATSRFSLVLNTDISFSILKSLFTTYFQDRIRSNVHLSTLLGTILDTSILDRDIFFHLVIFLCSSSFSLLPP